MTLRERLTASVTDIRARGQRLVQLNLELLTSELKAKGRKFGAAIGLFVAAALLALYAIGFLLATITVLLDLVLPLWAAVSIVTVALFAVVAILALVGRAQLRNIGDAQPEAAIAEAKATADLMKANVRGTAAGVRARMRPRPAEPVAGEQAPVAPVPAAPPTAAPLGGQGAPASAPPRPTAAPTAPPPSDPGAKDT
ncbi:MAG: phage holin family protein [Deltaproteobacteria bacterium]